MVANVRKEVIQNMMTEVRKAHDMSDVHTVVVNKDLNEISVIHRVAPNNSVHLCKFQVIQAINREVK